MNFRTVFFFSIIVVFSVSVLQAQYIDVEQFHTLADTNPRLAIKIWNSTPKQQMGCDSARVHFIAAGCHAQLGQTGAARSAYQKCFPCVVSYSQYESEIEILSAIATSYDEEGRSGLALEYYLRALKICKREKLYNWMGYMHLGLADIYHYWQDSARVISNLESAEKAFGKDPDPIALSYMHLAWMPYIDIPLDSFGYIMDAIEILHSYGDIDTYIYGYILLSRKYRAMEEQDSTLKYADLSRALSEQHDFPLYHLMATGTKSLILQQRGEYRSAIELLEPMVKISQYPDYKSGTHYQLYQNYNALGLADSALMHLEIYDSIEYSISIESELGNLADLDLKFQIDETSELLLEQNRRNRLLAYATISGFILFLLLGLILRQRVKIKRAVRESENKLKVEQERLEKEKYKELEEFKTRFFTNASHELRTPLTLIIDPLQNYLSGNNSNTENISLALSNSKKLLKLVNEIMEIAKIESGNVQITEESFDIYEEVVKCLAMFSTISELEKISFTIENKLNGLNGLRTDKNKFTTILENLVSNAIKYSSKDSEIQITLRTSSEGLEISIKDNGRGMTEDHIAKIFERYYRVEDSDPAMGTGIGLSLTKDLVEVLDAKIHVNSTLTLGSVFTVVFPIEKMVKCDLSANQESSKETEPRLEITGEKASVLLIEDNHDLANYLKKVIGKYYQVDVAHDGIAGLQQLQKRDYHLVISDIMMPKMGGLELRARINTIPRLRNLPYIFLTARSTQKEKLEGLALGVDDYITKPFDSQELLSRVENLILRRFEMKGVDQEEILDNVGESPFFVEKAVRFVNENLASTELGVNELAREMNYSSRQLNRHLKSQTGMTAVEFILEIRLRFARDIIENQHALSMQEIVSQIGLSSPSYFTRKFKERYGQTPTSLRKKFSSPIS